MYLKLISEGFNGKAYSTQESYEFIKGQMKQTVNGVFMHNNWVKGKRYQHGPLKGQWLPFEKSLYRSGDVTNAAGKFVSFENDRPGFPYNQEFKVSDNITGIFRDAGHIPGSAQIELNVLGKKLLFAYDLGRTDYKIANHPAADIPIVNPPYTGFGKDIEDIVIESTYGGKLHGSLEDSIMMFQEAMNDVSKSGGKLLIPSFSMMRMQMIFCFFYRLCEQNRVNPDFVLYSSCPTSDRIIKVMMKYIDDFDEMTKAEMQKEQNPFNYSRIIKHDKMQETLKLLRSNAGGYGITASSGMGDMGRVVGMFPYILGSKKNIVLGTGFSAEGTRMWMLQNGHKYLDFNETVGRVYVNADIRKMGGLSGHADSKEMIEHLKSIHNPDKGEQFKHIYIKHGEKESCHALKQKLIKAGFKDDTIFVMEKGKAYRVA